MPKIKKDKSVRLIHPNSRKALQISREKQKSNKRTTRINDKATKLDLKVKKLLWFQENMKEDILKYELSDIKTIVTEYLNRLNHELQQIEIIQSIGHRNPTQHTARERAIKLTKEHEEMLLRSTGIDIPDLTDPLTVSELRQWDGNSASAPKFQLMKITNDLLNTIPNQNK